MAGEEFPDWIVPMAATLTQDRFTGPDWVFERKFVTVRSGSSPATGCLSTFRRLRTPWPPFLRRT
jgi:hypothetical protein